MTSPNTRACPACGTVMPASFPEGLCPKCLLAAQVASVEVLDRTLPVAAPVSGAQTERAGGVPTLEALRGLFPELEILDVLGAGGMGAVYKARQPRLNRLVALKVMVAAPGHEADFALRFEREAQVLARLNHPHIVILYDFGELGAERTGADPLFYFLMEHVDGTDLGQIIKSKELTPAQALAIVPQICEALQYAHDQGITHRDIKPANILMDKRGGVKIADFGLAKVVGGAEEAMMTGLTQTGTAMGTPHYMAPEQWEHPEQVDHRADIYALGVVFYEMLTGERPAGVFEPPSKKTSPPVDRKLDKVVLRAMEKNPERRYQQAGEIRDDVTRISGAHKRRPAATGAEKPKGGPLKPLLAAGVASVLTVAGWFLWQGGATDTPAPAPPQAVWVPMYRQEAELAELLKSPTRLYPELKANPELARDPASGLKLAGGWLTPASTPVKLPLPSARNAGVRLRIRMSEPKRMDGASIWLRNVDGGIVYTGAWRGIMRHFGKAQKPAEYLAERKNLVPKKPGDSFTLEFYAIGTHLVCRYEGDVLRVSEPGENRAPGTLNHLMILNPVTDIEFINLDGLSEAEALKLAGVEGDQVSRPWVSAFPDPAKLPGLVESRDGWVLSDHLTVPVRTASGGEMRLLNAGLRARMRFSEGAGPEAAQLILRRGSRGGDHFELRYYRNLTGDRQNALQIRHWDHRSKQSTRLAGIGVDEDVHDAPGGFVLEFYAIGSRLHGRLNGAHPVNADVPDAAFVNPGEAGFAKLKDCWLTDMEILHLDGLPEAEALKLAGLGGDEARESGRSDDPAGAPWENLLDDPELKSTLRPTAAGYEARHWATVERGPGRDGAIRCRLLYDGKPNYFRLVALKQDKGWYQAYLMPGGGMIQYVDSELPVGKFKDLPEVETSRLPAALEPGQEVELELRVRGESLEFRVNGQVVCTGRDMHLGPGRWGFCNNSETPVTIRSLDFHNASSLEPGAGGLPSTELTLKALIHSGSRYTIIQEDLSWPDARRRAEELGRKLVVFESGAEEHAVREHFRAFLGQGCWIGGYAQEGAPDIRWLSGTSVGKVTWAVGHPYWRTNKDSGGARTEGLLWAAGLVLTGQSVQIQPQGRTLGFICEQPADASGRARDTPGPPGRLHGTGTLLSGKALDLTRCGAFDDFVDVAGGPDSWVALRASGQTLSSDGQADFTGIRKIARSYGGYHCFIDDAGGLRFHPAREMTLPASLKGRVIVDAACGSHHGVALLEDGQAVVFGKRYEEAMEDTTQAQGTGTPRWPQPDPAALRDVKGVAVTQTHAATLHHDGTVSVWGWQGPVTWQPEPELKPVRQLSSFHDALHLLDEAGQVWVFSLPRSVHPDQPVGFNGRVRRQAGQVARLRDHLWLRQDGTWGGVDADRPTMEMLGSVKLRPETNFALLASIAGAKPYGYALWIGPAADDEGAPKPAGPARGRLRASGTTANGKPHDLARFAAYDDFVDVAGGWGRWVALRAGGQTISSDGRADFTGIARIAARFNSEYAFITTKGKLVIPDYEVWTLPAELEQGVVDAALGMQHGIALLEGGRAVVFGARYEGVVGNPAQATSYGTPRWPAPEAGALEKVRAVAATVTHAATLHEDGSLSLWGWEGPLEWQADPRQQRLLQLRSTEDEFWALDEAGQLWRLSVPRNPAPGQPVYVTGKPSLSEPGVTHLRPRCWRRKTGVWVAHMNTKEGMALMEKAGITENTAFSLNGGLFDRKPFASLLWIQPVEAE